MKRVLSPLVTLIAVVLPMMIALHTNAGAQTVADSSRKIHAHVVARVIVVVGANNKVLQSNDGGRNWEAADVATLQNSIGSMQQKAASQRLVAEAGEATGSTPPPDNQTAFHPER